MSQRSYRLTPRAGDRLTHPSVLSCIMLSYTPVSSESSLSFSLFHRSLCTSVLSQAYYMSLLSPFLNRVIVSVFCDKCKWWGYSLLNFLQHFATASLVASNIVTSALFSKSPACVLPALWQAKSHSRTKRRAWLQFSMFLDRSLEDETVAAE